MQVAVPPGGSALREMTRSEKSEGHGAGVCGLFVVLDESTSRTKAADWHDQTLAHRQMHDGQGLSLLLKPSRLTPGQLSREVQMHNNAHSLHSPAKSRKSQRLETPSPWRVLADRGEF
jgi:hypothetical protein